jgi:hypothetical protein
MTGDRVFTDPLVHALDGGHVLDVDVRMRSTKWPAVDLRQPQAALA